MTQSVNLAQSEIEKTQAAFQNAQLKFENLILRIRLILKIPDDFVLRMDDKGKLYFEKSAPPPKP